MRLRLLSLTLTALLGATSGQEKPTVDTVLGKHIASLGNEAIARQGDYVLHATGTLGGQPMRLRVLVRRSPFAYREELLPLTPGAQATALLSDGRYAWLLLPKAPQAPMAGEPLRDAFARATLEHAFFEGFLYLQPDRIGDSNVDTLWRLPTWPGVPADFEVEPEVTPVAFRTPAGTLHQYQFDSKDGRLHAITTIGGGAWIRFGAWRKFGELFLPSKRVMGFPGGGPHDVDTLVIDDVTSGVQHADAMFAGNPAPRLDGRVRAGALEIQPHSTPSAAHVVLREVVVNQGLKCPALVDTGADEMNIVPQVADMWRLPHSGPQRLRTGLGTADTTARWIDTLAAGDHRALQLVSYCLRMPGFPQQPVDRPVPMIYGGAELMQRSPLFDLEHLTLWLRGAGAPRLEGALEVPVQKARAHRATLTLEIEVDGKKMRALLDTGWGSQLRLMPRALVRLGLPTTKPAWLARGGLPTVVTSAGGARGEDLYARMPSFRLGAIEYERPLVAIHLGTSDDDGSYDAIVGFGAFLQCRAFALDSERMTLAIVPGPLMLPRDGGGFSVPAPGEYLGVVLGAPRLDAKAEPASLPEVIEVSEGSPAARGGLRVGEHVVAIDGRACAGRPASEWNPALWVDHGKSVALTVRGKEGKTRIVSLP